MANTCLRAVEEQEKSKRARALDVHPSYGYLHPDWPVGVVDEQTGARIPVTGDSHLQGVQKQKQQKQKQRGGRENNSLCCPSCA